MNIRETGNEFAIFFITTAIAAGKFSVRILTSIYRKLRVTRHSPTSESEMYKNHVFTHANITMQLAVRNSFFLVIIFQVSKRMKSPTKKETLFASVFAAKAYTLRTEGRD